MARLGEFGAALRELDPATERDTFQFFGEEFAVTGDIPPMLMLQLGASATGKIDEAEGMAAMWEALRCSLTEPGRLNPEGTELLEDSSAFNRLYKLAVTRRADMDGLLKLVFALFEVQGGRPTVAAPDSSGGPLTTSPSSSASSSATPVSPFTSVPQVTIPGPQGRPGEHPALAHLRPVSELLTG